MLGNLAALTSGVKTPEFAQLFGTAEAVPSQELLMKWLLARQNRKALEHNPPMGRGATSIGQTPCSFKRNSACTGPCVNPKARTADRKELSMPRCSESGNRDGVT